MSTAEPGNGLHRALSPARRLLLAIEEDLSGDPRQCEALDVYRLLELCGYTRTLYEEYETIVFDHPRWGMLTFPANSLILTVDATRRLLDRLRRELDEDEPPAP